MIISDEIIDDSLNKKEFNRRVGSVKDWLSGLELILYKTHNKVAKNILETVFQKPAVAKPINEMGMLLHVIGPKDPSIILVPVLEEDSKISETTTTIAIKKDPAAIYVETSPGRIYFNAFSPMSDNWRGILLFHEAAHAHAHYNNLYRTGNPNDKWVEEVEVLMFEQSLARSIGGSRYQMYLNQQLARFKNEYRDLNGTGGKVPKLSEVEKLDSIFCPALSEEERLVRKTVVYFDVVYRLFEFYYPETFFEEKVMFTKQVNKK